MALIRFGANVSEMIGRSKGSVYQRVKGGIIMRTAAVNLNTSKSNTYKIKNNAAQIMQAWQTLSKQDRQLWEVYAQFRNRPTRKSSNIPLSGQATFMLENSIRLQFDQAEGVATLGISTTPIITTPPQTIGINTITNVAGVLTIDLDFFIQPAIRFAFVYITKPLLPSQLSIWNKTKLIPNLKDTGAGQDVTARYLNLYGILPTPGQEVNTKTFLYDKDSKTFGSGNSQRVIIT